MMNLKKKLKQMPKKVMVLMMIIAILTSYFSPLVNVFAVSSTTKLSVGFRDDNFNYGIVQYSLNDGADWIDVTENQSNINISVVGDNLRLRIVPNNNYFVDYAGIELGLDETRYSDLAIYGFESSTGYSVPADVETVSLEQVEFRKSDEAYHPNYENNASSKVTINIDGEELEYNNPWSEDAADFIFGINNSEMRRLSKEEVNYKLENNEIVGLETKNQIDYAYNYNDSETVTFNIGTQWDDLIESLIINGVLYDTPRTKEALISSFRGRAIRFDIPNVPYAETYEIEVIGRKQNTNEKIMGNFGWTYDPNTNEYSDDDKIPHGNLQFVKAVYNNITFNSPEEVNAEGGIFEWNDGVKGTDDPTGEAMFPTETELTIKLIPDAGYQLTSFDLNGTPFETGDEVGLYTFTISGGNWHLGAHFTEVNDEVQTNSSNIKSGDININKSENADFESGTAKLEVNDVISMSPNRMEQFESAANNQGYELENYLDISLYNTVYKGGNKDVNGNYESWDKLVEYISEKATITLELENDMSGKELAIIHEKHTGDTITGYELINVVYNEENNTITFETDSFSNYAIISKALENSTMYTVHFNSRGGSEIEDKNVISGNSVAEPAIPTNGELVFGGWYEDETLSTKFDFNTPIVGDVTLYAKWESDEKEYIISNELATAIFSFNDGFNFSLNINDLLAMTSDEIESVYDVSADDFEMLLEIIKNNVKQYGDLISLYDITIDDGGLGYSDDLKLKLKLTETMQNYNTLKLIYLDENDNFNVSDIKNLTINSETADGDLDHLSVYALVGSNVEIPSETNEINNPQTGDHILMWISLLLISTIGLFIGIITARKLKK